ncbi:MAG TPA: hypothetical protein VIA29_08345 [Thermoanaerobaculia bacterium]
MKETPGPDGRTFFRVHLENEPSPEWMRAWRAGLLGLMPEDRDAVMRLEFQGASVRFPAQDGEVGRIRGVLERRIESVNQILSGGRSAPSA